MLRRSLIFKSMRRLLDLNMVTGTMGKGTRSSVAPLKVTLFGASTGTLGRNVVYELGDIGVTCMIPFRGDMDETNHLRVNGEPGKINPMPFHPRDEESIRDCIGNSDIVLNFAGKYYETKSLLLKKNYTYQDVNIFFPQRLARICNEMGVKHFLHVSALQQDIHHKSEWARSKAKGEEVVRSIKPETCIVRPADMYGHDDRFLTWIGHHLRLYTILLKIGGGHALKQPVTYDDVSIAILKYCLDPDRFTGTTMELAGPDVLQWGQIVDMVCDVAKWWPSFPPTPPLLAKCVTRFLEMGPKPYMSSSQVDLQTTDCVINPNTAHISFKDLGITPQRLQDEIFDVCYRYRRGGHLAYSRHKEKPYFDKNTYYW